MSIKRLTPRQMLEMGLVMAKISCFTFGGGWSILAQMQREYSEKRGWIAEEELMDFASVGRSLPGIMILNNTTMFGYRLGGVAGAVIADLGLVLPPLIVICIVTGFYDAIKDNVWVAKAMVGVRAAVVPVILEASVKLGKKGLIDKIAWIVMLAALAKLDAAVPEDDAVYPAVVAENAVGQVTLRVTEAAVGEWVAFEWESTELPGEITMTICTESADGMAVNYLYDIVSEEYVVRMPVGGLRIGLMSVYA